MVFRKIRTFVLLCFLCCLSWIDAQAAYINEKTAQALAQRFYLSQTGEPTILEVVRTEESYAAKDSFSLRMGTEETPLFYVFNMEPCGFMLISAYDNVQPILGYSFTSSFDAENIPDNVAKQLSYYRDAIQYAVNHQIKGSIATEQAWEKLKGSLMADSVQVLVGPLLSSEWGQDYPYNDKCPYDAVSQKRCITGCVATAMASILHYWGYPQKGMNSHAYDYGSYGNLSADFNTTYSFQNMPSILTDSSTTTQIEAVATLMYHCGVAVEMQYGTSFSSSYTLEYWNDCPSAELAFKEYFDYDSVKGIERTSYTDSAWIALIQEELYYGRPILYGGSNYSNTSAHAFVCDGYDNQGYFHFNWGWDGYYNGYFLVGNLNPGGYNFSYNQEAIIHIQPSHLNASITTATKTLHLAYPGDSIHPIAFKGNLLTDSIHLSTRAPFYLSIDGIHWETDRKASLLGGEVMVGYLPKDATIHSDTLFFSSGEIADTMILFGNSLVCHPDTLPYQEDFEDSIRRYCWHQEITSGDGEWIVRKGGNIFPSTAHSGECNAYFPHQKRGNATKLVTPELQLPDSQEVVLSFWHTQQRWNQDQDTLRVFYKNHPDSLWVLLHQYHNSITIWTKDSLLLPSPSKQYWIAFEATDNYGYGVSLDDIHIIALEKIPEIPDTIPAPDTIPPMDSILVIAPSQLTENILFDTCFFISWTENDTAQQWEIACDTAGFLVDSCNHLLLSTQPSYLFYGLPPNIYEVYVRSVVNDSLVSSWSHPIRVNTRILYVKPDGKGDGSSWENAMSQVQTAIDSAAAQQPSARVWVAHGTYHPTAYIEGEEDDLRMRSFMLHDVSIYGGFEGYEKRLDQRKRIDINGDSIINDWEFQYPSILSGDFLENDSLHYLNYTVKNNTENAYHVVYGTSAGICIDGFTIKGGYANHISNGNHVYAAAVYADSCTLINNIIERNMAVSSLPTPIYGGAVYLRYGFIKQCLIRRNSSSSNTASVYGGAVFNQRGKIEYSILYNNLASSIGSYTYGGAVYNERISAVNNCLIYNNSAISTNAIGYGGGIYNHDYNTLITNSTIAHNEANEYAAIHSGNVKNCILEGDAQQGLYTHNAYSHSSLGDSTNLPTSFEAFGLVLPSSFSGIAKNINDERMLNVCDWTLTATSALIDRGHIDSTMTDTLDLSGQSRIYNSLLDIGAYEYHQEFRHVNALQLVEDSLVIYLYRSDTLQVNVFPINAHNRTWEVLYQASDSILSVDSLGIIQSIRKGLDTIVVRSIDGNYTDTCRVWVLHQEVDSILLLPKDIQIRVGDSLNVQIAIYPENASDVGYTFEYYGDSVISVLPNGYLKGEREGFDTIIVHSNDDIHSDTCVIHILRGIPIDSIRLNMDTLLMYKGGVAYLIAEIYPDSASNQTILWTCEQPGIVIVNAQTSSLYANNAGETYVKATTQDGHFSDSCLVKVLIPTDIASSLSSNDIFIYPNPATDFIRINGLLPSDRLSVWSMDGCLLRYIKGVDMQELLIIDLPQGIYLLKIQREDQCIVRKLLKQ